MRKKPIAAVGGAENANTVVLVTLSSASLLDRRLVTLTPPSLPTHPYHHEGSWAVGRFLNTPGARPISLSAAIDLIEKVRAAALEGAQVALAGAHEPSRAMNDRLEARRVASRFSPAFALDPCGARENW